MKDKKLAGNRLESAMQAMQNRNEKALATFLMGGDPDLKTSYHLLMACLSGGADILEIGVPFSDPLADGPIIQKAAARALRQKINLSDILALVKLVRERSDIPVVLLVYFNSLFNYGLDKFAVDARKAGVDALVIPDLPYEEKRPVERIFARYDIITIDFLAPTTGERAACILKKSRGFIYCVAVAGVTGVRENLPADLQSIVQNARKYTQTPLLAGFGISGSAQAAAVSLFADGVIVGSALVGEIEKHGHDKKNLAAVIEEKVKAIKWAMGLLVFSNLSSII